MTKPDIAVLVPDASPGSIRFVARGLAIHENLNSGSRRIAPTEEEIQAKMDEARALVLARGPAQA